MQDLNLLAKEFVQRFYDWPQKPGKKKHYRNSIFSREPSNRSYMLCRWRRRWNNHIDCRRRIKGMMKSTFRRRSEHIRPRNNNRCHLATINVKYSCANQSRSKIRLTKMIGINYFSKPGDRGLPALLEVDWTRPAEPAIPKGTGLDTVRLLWLVWAPAARHWGGKIWWWVISL